MGINDVFTHQTPYDLAAYLSNKVNNEGGQEIELTHQIKQAKTETNHEMQRLYPLTLLQACYLEQAQFGNDTIFNIPFAFKLDKSIDVDILKSIFLEVIECHTALRSLIILGTSNEPQQCILTMQEVKGQEWFTHCTALNGKAAREIVLNAGGYRFDLRQEIPIRISYVSVTSELSYLSVLIYHSAFDEWSAKLFIDEFLDRLVLKLNTHPSAVLPKRVNQPAQYYEYALEESSHHHRLLVEGLAFWQDKLGRLTEQEALAACQRKPLDEWVGGNDDTSSSIRFSFDLGTKNALLNLALHLKTSLFQVIYGVVVLALHQLGAGKDIVVATSTACREDPRYHGTIGLFTNVILNRVLVTPEIKLYDFFKEIQTSILSAIAYAQTPFPLLLTELADESASNLIEYYIQMHARNPLNCSREINGEMIHLELLEQQAIKAKFGLHFEIYDEPSNTEDSLVFLIHFMRDKYSVESLEPLRQCLLAIIKKVISISSETLIEEILW